MTFDLIITSPLTRTRQTAEVFAEHLEGKPTVIQSDALAPAGTPAAVMQEIAKHARKARIALVGHEPNIGELTARLIGARSPIEFKKGAICRIDFDVLPPKALGQLRWFMPPRVLRKAGYTEPPNCIELTVMTTVAHVILSSLDALGSRLPLVSDGDADGIHDARVATRRLRAALPLLSVSGATDWFEQVTPTATALGKALGRAREEDEALRLLDEIERRSPGAAAAAATLRARLLPRQLRRRRQLIKTIESLDLETLDRLREMVRRQSGFRGGGW